MRTVTFLSIIFSSLKKEDKAVKKSIGLLLTFVLIFSVFSIAGCTDNTNSNSGEGNFNYNTDMQYYYNNISNAKRILGENNYSKIYKLLDFTEFSRDVADPWYTGDFSATERDVDNGCEGLLKFILSKNSIK